MKLKKFKSFSLGRSAELYKAVSDEARIRILAIIYTFGEICVSDLEMILDFTQTKTSRHITYLKNVQLISHKRIEKWIYYELKEEYRDFVSQLIDNLDKDDLIKQDFENYKTMYGNSTLSVRLLHNKQRKYNLPEL